jgi:hypothetical protein
MGEDERRVDWSDDDSVADSLVEWFRHALDEARRDDPDLLSSFAAGSIGFWFKLGEFQVLAVPEDEDPFDPRLLE